MIRLGGADGKGERIEKGSGRQREADRNNPKLAANYVFRHDVMPPRTRPVRRMWIFGESRTTRLERQTFEDDSPRTANVRGRLAERGSIPGLDEASDPGFHASPGETTRNFGDSILKKFQFLSSLNSWEGRYERGSMWDFIFNKGNRHHRVHSSSFLDSSQ